MCPGFLAAACRIDGTGNEGNNEGSFRKMLNRRNNSNICAPLEFGDNEPIFHFLLSKLATPHFLYFHFCHWNTISATIDFSTDYCILNKK